jgi:hypothetical protein
LIRGVASTFEGEVLMRRAAAVAGGRVWAGLALLLLAAPAARAQGSQVPGASVPAQDAPLQQAPAREIPRLYPYYRVGAAARVNPLGLFTNITFQLRYRLYESESPALKDNYLGVGPVAFVSPALVRGGLGVEFAPLTVLQLSASYEGVRYLGGFDYLQSFPSANTDASDDTLELLSEAGRNYASNGTLLTLGALLQAKVGPIAVRTNPRLFHFDQELREGDRVFYEPVLDITVPDSGWTLSNDADLLYVTGGLALGLRYSATHSYYGEESFAPGEADLGLNPTIHRVGPFLAYTFHDDPSRLFNTPTLVLITQWHLSHRYRAGEQVSQALPWVALAFQFKGIP